MKYDRRPPPKIGFFVKFWPVYYAVFGQVSNIEYCNDKEYFECTFILRKNYHRFDAVAQLSGLIMELLTPKDQPFKTELYKVRIYGVFRANSPATLKKIP